MDQLVPLLDGFQYDDRMRHRGLDYLHAWHDKELKAGNQWDTEIQLELDSMDIFVPLVSSNFFASEYIQNVELPKAIQRHALHRILVVPILLYDVNLRDKCKFLHGFRVFPAADRWWSSFPDRMKAHRPIDDGLWAAIDAVLECQQEMR